MPSEEYQVEGDEWITLPFDAAVEELSEGDKTVEEREDLSECELLLFYRTVYRAKHCKFGNQKQHQMTRASIYYKYQESSALIQLAGDLWKPEESMN